MTIAPIKVEVCCDPACENYNIQQEIPLTAEEIATREEAAAQAAEDRAAAIAAAEALAALKASAKAKLIAGQPLTAEEADTLVI
jgi:hypothetical protein